MLVLTCKDGERVHIGDGIIVTVLQTRAGRVRLGVAAPSEVSILRGKLWDDLRQDPPALFHHLPALPRGG